MASKTKTISSNRRRRVTFMQLEILWKFLNAHKEIAMGFNKTAQARHYSMRMWESITNSLNSQGQGSVKNWKEWSNYWVDYKSKLKKRVAAVRLSQDITGEGPSSVPALSNIEEKFLGLIMGYSTGLPNIQDPQAQTDCASSENEVDTEDARVTHQEKVLPQEVVLVKEEILPQEEELPSPIAVSIPPLLPHPPKSHRLRRRKAPYISKEEALYTLIDINKKRLKLEQKNSETLQQMCQVLNKMAEKIDQMGSSRKATSDDGKPGS